MHINDSSSNNALENNSPTSSQYINRGKFSKT
jgi:hypothetical protein